MVDDRGRWVGGVAAGPAAAAAATAAAAAAAADGRELIASEL